MLHDGPEILLCSTDWFKFASLTPHPDWEGNPQMRLPSGAVAHLGQHRAGLAKGGVDERRMHVKDCVVEVCIGIGAGPCPQQALALGAAQKGHMLHQVRNALLILFLIHTPCTQALDSA